MILCLNVCVSIIPEIYCTGIGINHLFYVRIRKKKIERERESIRSVKHILTYTRATLLYYGALEELRRKLRLKRSGVADLQCTPPCIFHTVEKKGSEMRARVLYLLLTGNGPGNEETTRLS